MNARNGPAFFRFVLILVFILNTVQFRIGQQLFECLPYFFRCCVTSLWIRAVVLPKLDFDIGAVRQAAVLSAY